jgi:hypothetical protein
LSTGFGYVGRGAKKKLKKIESQSIKKRIETKNKT